VPQPSLGCYVHPQGMAHDVARSAREHAYLDVEQARQRRERQLSLDAGEPKDSSWLPQYTTGWLDQAAVDRGGRYDRVAEVVRSSTG
jgi:hypothetical protein